MIIDKATVPVTKVSGCRARLARRTWRSIPFPLTPSHHPQISAHAALQGLLAPRRLPVHSKGARKGAWLVLSGPRRTAKPTHTTLVHAAAAALPSTAPSSPFFPPNMRLLQAGRQPGSPAGASALVLPPQRGRDRRGQDTGAQGSVSEILPGDSLSPAAQELWESQLLCLWRQALVPASRQRYEGLARLPHSLAPNPPLFFTCACVQRHPRPVQLHVLRGDAHGQGGRSGTGRPPRPVNSRGLQSVTCRKGQRCE